MKLPKKLPYINDFQQEMIIEAFIKFYNKGYEIALECLKNGVNILIEKPITSTIRQGEELIKIAEKDELVVAVGQIERHNPVVGYTKEGIEKNMFGELITISSRRVSSNPGRIRDVGVILDLGIHDIDVRYNICDFLCSCIGIWLSDDYNGR